MSDEAAIPTPGMVSAVNLPPQEGPAIPQKGEEQSMKGGEESKDEEEEHRGDLLEQFYLTLGVMHLGSSTEERLDVHKRIAVLFGEPHSWRNAYDIEQHLCLVTKELQLTIELNRRLKEAKGLKLEYLDVIEEWVNGDVAAKRAALQRLLNDLQWFYVKRVQQRSAGKRLMRRVSALFVIALFTLFLVLLIQFFAHPVAAPSTATATPGQPAAAPPQPAPATQPTPAAPQPAPANGAVK